MIRNNGDRFRHDEGLHGQEKSLHSSSSRGFAMRIKTILPFVVTLAISIWPSAHAGEEPKPANAQAEKSAEAQAKADYEAAEKAVKEAEAVVAPLRAALQKADTESANATKAATAKRQQATDSKNMAGEAGAKELQQAEANVPIAIKALADATEGKPAADKAFDEAKAAAAPLQQAYEVAEKARSRRLRPRRRSPLMRPTRSATKPSMP